MSAFEGGPCGDCFNETAARAGHVLHIGAHIEVGEIATVLDLRFADGTVVRVRQQGANLR
jgi:hypothetical protein